MDTEKVKSKDKGQVKGSAAKIYEDLLVPALFKEWAPRMAEAAHVKSGDKVLDVACGTGVLSRYMQEQLNATVTGLDMNEDMLAVAKSINPEIMWNKGIAESLPYEDNSFDAVVSQFGLMFFSDAPKAIQEMMRVLKKDKRMAVAVWDDVNNSPGYAALIELLQQEFGEEVADKLRAPFLMGNKTELSSLFESVGVQPDIVTRNGIAQYTSIDAWVYTDVRGWVYSDMISDDQLDSFLKVAREALSPFVRDDGKVQFKSPAHIVTATKT